jgi:DNA-binding transcriptional LysR family regulator
MPLAPADVVLEHLMDDPLYVALSREHPLADSPTLRMEDLRDETWIEGRDSVCTRPLLRAARDAGFEPRIGFESAQWLGKQGLVAAGVGVTLIPTLALATVRDDIVLRSLGDAAPRRRVSVATHAWLSPPPSVEPMREILQRVAREHCFSCDAMVAV